MTQVLLELYEAKGYVQALEGRSELDQQGLSFINDKINKAITLLMQ